MLMLSQGRRRPIRPSRERSPKDPCQKFWIDVYILWLYSPSILLGYEKMFSDLTYVAAVVLIPLMPAFVLYKFLPSGTTKVKGPFRGLDIKLSGAFAGYFLVVLMVTSFVIFLIKRRPPEKPPDPLKYQYEVYTVAGKVELKDDSAPKPDYEGIKLSLAPSQVTINPDGSFSFEIPVRPGQLGAPDFPRLLVTHQDDRYSTATIPLSEKSPDTEFTVVH